jgi:hypothetical protein
MLTPGQASDLHGFDALAGTIQADVLIADKGYDADKRVRAVLAAAGKTAVIPHAAIARTRWHGSKRIRNATKSGTRSRTSSAASRTFVASPPATKDGQKLPRGRANRCNPDLDQL